MIYNAKLITNDNDIIVDDSCPSIIIDDIFEQTEPICYFDAGLACTNTHTFTAVIRNSIGEVEYHWAYSSGVIIGTTTEPLLTLEVVDNKNTVLDIVLTVGDAVSGAVLQKQFISQHILRRNENCLFAFTDGEWVGYELNSFGFMQLVTSEEILYAVKWRADIFVVKVGENGDTKLTDVDVIRLRYLGRDFVLNWNDVDKQYDTDDAKLLIELAESYVICERVYCFAFSYLTSLTIHTDFEELIDEKI